MARVQQTQHGSVTEDCSGLAGLVCCERVVQYVGELFQRQGSRVLAAIRKALTVTHKEVGKEKSTVGGRLWVDEADEGSV